LYVLRRGEDKLSSCSTNLKSITSVVEHHQNVFLLHAAPDAWKVKMCLADKITKTKDLFEFDKTSDAVAVMAVSDRYVVVKDPDTEQLIIYDFMSQQKKEHILICSVYSFCKMEVCWEFLEVNCRNIK